MTVFQNQIDERSTNASKTCVLRAQWGFLGGIVVKNPSANAGDARDAGSISGSGRPPEEEMATHSSTPAWRISRTEEPGGVTDSDMTDRAHTHKCCIS